MMAVTSVTAAALMAGASEEFALLVVPFVLFYGYGVNLPIPFLMLTVGIGEVLSCGVIGTILLLALERYRGTLFGTHGSLSA